MGGGLSQQPAIDFRIVVGQLDKSVFAINGNPSVLPQPKVTSLPGLRGTGNAAPGASGATNGERVYTITVKNTASLPSVPPDTVQDTLPAGYVFSLQSLVRRGKQLPLT